MTIRTKPSRARAAVYALGLVLASASQASAWNYEFERGLHLYRASSGGVVLSLVCDPDLVYGPRSESALLVQIGGDDDYSGPVEIAFPDDTAVTTQAVHGRIGKREIADEVWQPLLAGLRAHDTLQLTMSGPAQTVSTGEAQDFTCD